MHKCLYRSCQIDSLTMDQTQILSLNSVRSISLASVMPNSSTYKSVKKAWWQHCLRFAIGNILLALDSTWTVKSMTTLPKQRMNKASTKKAILNKDFRQAESWLLTANHMRHKSLDSMRLKIPFVAPCAINLWCPSRRRRFGRVVEKQLVTYGDHRKGVSWQMVKQARIAPEKSRLHLRKPKLNCKTRSSPQPFGLYYQIRILAWSNKRAPSNNSESALVKCCSGIFKRYRMMISKISPTSVIQLLQETTISSGGGWQPDYQDPSTYLETISPVNGSVFYHLGIDEVQNNPAIATVGLDQY